MVAFIPICNWERETASHSTGSDGISTIGVGSVSVTGGIVGDGVRVGVLVSVGGSGVGDEVFVGGGEVEETGTVVSVGESGVNVAGKGLG